MRTESCRIKMNLDKEAADRHAPEIELLIGKNVLRALNALGRADNLVVDWKFIIEYFDDCAERLAAINRICQDPKVILSADCELLEEAQCLIFETLTHLKQVIQTLKG